MSYATTHSAAFCRCSCIHEFVEIHADRIPNAIAIAAPGRLPLTYGRLRAHLREVVRLLNAMGIGRDDRVALVVPNGPEMATALLAITAGSTCAPLNPAFHAGELDFYLSDINAKALVISSGFDSPARSIARERDIAIIELSPVPEAEAGVFRLAGDGSSMATRGGLAEAEDVALVLYTSGTTSRPKAVPLTQNNLSASAYNIGATLELAGSDCCLNVMPLFHIHGLVGALLSSMATGASVVCAPGFYVSKFFDWLEEFRPSWYTAVPTMHRAIVEHARQKVSVIKRCPLRFIRSCSSPLPPQLMTELEEIFAVPVVEAYGMTEAAHQIASNPLPPRPRKPRSVGVPTGQEIAVVNESGDPLPVGQAGEIIIRGANVTRGYENNEAANKDACIKGWFRTGDQGCMDADGYLFLTGRLKEIINRAGEKISPWEIEQVLLEHSAVSQAVTFPVPHETLGEDVGAAVVLRQEAGATEKELREFVARRLSFFKVPRHIFFLPEIPKTASGKIQRTALAERLKLNLSEPALPESRDLFVAPRTPVEEFLASIWAEVLALEQVSVHARFLDLGGDSMLATRLVSRLRQDLKLDLSLLFVFDAPTVAQQAVILEEMLLRAEDESEVGNA